VSSHVTPKMVEALGRRHLMLFSGRASHDLAAEVATYLGIECGSVDLRDFANGETYARFQESVRGTDAFVIQTHSAQVNERIMEQLIMIDALKRGSAKRISAVVPYYGYSRQDKKGRSREPITAKLVADLLQSAGADRIITIDLHSGQIQGFFDGPVDHLTALPVLADHIRQNYPGELVVVAPDAGRVKAAEKLAGVLGQSLAFLHKRRSRDVANQVQVREVVGEVDGRLCVMIDDIIDTAGTIVQGAEVLVASGAQRVIAAATHGIFSGPAIDRLKNAPLSEVVVTNTLPVPDEQRLDKIVVLSIAKILADAIRAVFEDASVSEIFNDQNQL
jgi:ribose-phosphate pyrophosphokinase